MNTETATAEPAVETEATQADLPVVALFDPARLPERDEGFTYHPDLALMVIEGDPNDADNDDGRIDPAKVAAAGFSLNIVPMPDTIGDAAEWTPEGEGQLVAIYDNEHGTFAAFVTPKDAPAPEPESEPAEFPAGYTDAEPEIAINHDAVAVSMHEANHPYGGRPEEFIPAAAYRMADAMIAAREQRT